MTEPMSEERLAEIADAEAKASRGPWTRGIDRYSVSGPDLCDGYSELQVSVDVGDPADATFIAVAREAVPELLAEVARLKAVQAKVLARIESSPEAFLTKPSQNMGAALALLRSGCAS